MAIQPVPAAPAALPFPGLNEKAAGTYNATAFAWGNQMPAYADGIKALGENVHTNATETKANADITTTKAAEGAAARDVAVAAAITALTAPGTLANSTTSMTVTQGEPAFLIEAGKNLRAGMFVTIAAPGGQVMYGRIQSYDSATGEIKVLVSYTEGAGTYSQWIVAISGPPARIPRNKLFYFSGA